MAPTAAEWDGAYRTGRHTELWDTPWPSPELAGALALLPDNGRAVDLGCGTGSDAILLARRGMRVLGVDLSPTAIAMAKAKARDAAVAVDWAVADVAALPVADVSVDLATDRGCLHYLGPDDRREYVAELARALRPGGTAFIRGMAAPQRHKVAVTEEAVRRLFTPPTFEVVAVLGFTMLGANSSAPATLAVVKRSN